MNTFGQKMMVNGDLQFLLKILHVQNYFLCFIKLPQIKNSVTKMTFYAQEGISNKKELEFVRMINETLSHF
jgi:hypothetical protein